MAVFGLALLLNLMEIPNGFQCPRSIGTMKLLYTTIWGLGVWAGTYPSVLFLIFFPFHFHVSLFMPFPYIFLSSRRTIGPTVGRSKAFWAIHCGGAFMVEMPSQCDAGVPGHIDQ